MVGSDWQITRFENGIEENFTKKQFIDSLKESVIYTDNQNFGNLAVAESKKKYM